MYSVARIFRQVHRQHRIIFVDVVVANVSESSF